MDVAAVVYEDHDGRTQRLETGQRIQGGTTVQVEEVEIDEGGEWVMIHTTDPRGNEDSIMIPRDRVYAIYEGSNTDINVK